MNKETNTKILNIINQKSNDMSFLEVQLFNKLIKFIDSSYDFNIDDYYEGLIKVLNFNSQDLGKFLTEPFLIDILKDEILDAKNEINEKDEEIEELEKEIETLEKEIKNFIKI